MYELISDHMVIIMTMNKISDGVDKCKIMVNDKS